MAGRLVHFELPADDTARARDFWSSLFGWSFRGWDGPIEYHMTEGVDPGGAIYPADGDERGPIVYFDVDDMDAAIGRVRELRSEEHTSELQSHSDLVCRLLLEKKKNMVVDDLGTAEEPHDLELVV